jgi:tripartite-type tricarboxylate transporter receptor subunit TctC
MKPVGAVMALTLACVAAPALAQSYPAKPVRVISQFAAGSGGDTISRPVMEAVSQYMGQPFGLENRAGAGGLLAAELVSKSDPDGYTVLVATTGGHISRPFLLKNARPFSLLKDLTPITGLGDTPLILVAHPSVPVSSFRELLAYAKANPGKLSYGTSGIGSSGHLMQEEIKMLTGADIVHVPYKAGAQAMADVLSGVTGLSYTIVVSVRPSIVAGKLKAFASAAASRGMGLPDVPTIGEMLPSFEPVNTWTALFGPPRLPEPILRRLNAETNRALKELAPRIEQIGFVPVGSSAEEFAASIERQTRLVERIVKAAGIQPQDE